MATIASATNSNGEWLVWVPREYEAPESVLALYHVRHEHPGGRDYIPVADRNAAVRLVDAINTHA